MLKIVSREAEIKVPQVICTILGQPGIGKTTLGTTAAKPLLLDFDKGIHRARHRCDHVEISMWRDVMDMNADDLKDYETIVVDTVGRMVDCMASAILSDKQGYAGASTRSGTLTQKGYGYLKTMFISIVERWRGFGLDVVFISHGKEDLVNDQLKSTIDIVGGSKDEVYKISDVMGMLRAEGDARVLRLDPMETQYGKNPAGLAPLLVPPPEENDHVLADIISDSRKGMEALSEAQLARQKELKAVKKKVKGFGDDVGKFNKAVKDMAGASKEEKLILMDGAKAAGIVWDKKGKKFESLESEPEPEGDPDAAHDAAADAAADRDADEGGEL